MLYWHLLLYIFIILNHVTGYLYYILCFYLLKQKKIIKINKFIIRFRITFNLKEFKKK